MSDAPEDLHALTALLYDGELDRDGELRARAHLAECEACQRELEDLMGIDAAVQTAGRKQGDMQPVIAGGPEPDVIPLRRTDDDFAPGPGSDRRQIWFGLGGLALVAAAAIALVVWNRRPREAEPALALAPTRSLEVRWSAPAFAPHRPYAVVRGSELAEDIPLATLARLERRGDRAALVAAAASAGDRKRAELAAQSLADDAAGRADRAALALVDHQPALALEALGSPAGDSAAGAWNRALALRDLDLPFAAEAAFTAIGARGEAGWSDEAGTRADALVGALEARRTGLAELRARGAAMVAGTGPALTADDARRFPAFTRHYLLDALRVGVDRAALAPVAAALDAGAGDDSARAALNRVAGRDAAVRARFAERYRALAAGALPAAEATALVDALIAAGPAVDDLAIGAIIATRSARPRLDQLAAIAARDGDPWYLLAVDAERARALRERDPAAAAGDLAPRVERCPAGLAFRCGELAMDLALAQILVGQPAAAESAAAHARALYAAAGAYEHELRALEVHADAARHRGQAALAAALFDELIRRSDGDAGCATRRYARIGLAEMALAAGDADGARVALPDPGGCAAPLDPIAVVTAVDLARQTGRDDDRFRAGAWITTPGASDDPRLPTTLAIGKARLLADRDGAAGETALAAAIADAPGGDPTILGWAWSARVSVRAASGDWSGVIALAAAEVRRPPPARCAVVVSADDDRLTVAVRGADGTTTGALRRLPRAAQAAAAALTDADRAHLAGCAEVPVFARAPFHGRADLMPPGVPWSFAGEAPPSPPTALPPRVVVVADPASAAGRELPRLAPPRPIPGATTITGADATPRRVLAELLDATYVELHVHGVVDLANSDASYLALAPGPDGAATLTAGDLRAVALRGAPIVVLAACRASARVGHLHARWSLPEAFRAAGARAVVAADVDLPDVDATALFDRFRGELARGATPAAALATARTAYATAPWAAHVMLFE